MEAKPGDISDSSRLRVLLIAEAANPEWTSVPLIGWSVSRALAACPDLDVHTVTQIRNRDAFVRAGLVEGQDFTAIDSDRLGSPLYKLSSLLRGGAGKGWTTVAALNALGYYYFERLVWKRFRKDLESGRYHLVHRVTPLSPTAASSLATRCRKLGVPFVLGPLNGGLPWPRQFEQARRREREWLSYVRKAYRLLPGYHSTRRDATAIMVASEATLNEIPAKYRDKCLYLPENGIDTARFARRRERKAERPIRGIFVGRLVPYKGADMLLESAAPLMRAGELTIDIVGDGPEMPRLREIVAREQIESATRLLGWVPHTEVANRMIDADLFTFPSIREFGGGAVMEAMAVGLAPVIVDYGGPSELVTQRTGAKVPLGSRDEIIRHFRALLTQLVADPARIDALSDAAYKRARALFTWEAKAAQILQVYRWVLKQGPRPDFPLPLPDPD